MNTKSKYKNEKWIGQKFNDLTVVGFEHKTSSNGKHRWCWKLKCECGKDIVASPYKVINGKIKSCGCAKAERCRNMTEKYRLKHGGRGERLYHIWRGMKMRCLVETSKDYKRWGGRGIKMCDEWVKDYVAFRTWAHNNGYNESLSLDRIDVNGDYCPDNCRWATTKDQSRNKANTLYVNYRGENKPLADLCDERGYKYKTVYGRIFHNGWSVEDALTIPVLKRNGFKR